MATPMSDGEAGSGPVRASALAHPDAMNGTGPPIPGEPLVTTREVAHALGVSMTSVQRMTRAGMPSRILMVRTRRYYLSECLAWVNGRGRTGDAVGPVGAIKQPAGIAEPRASDHRRGLSPLARQVLDVLMAAGEPLSDAEVARRVGKSRSSVRANGLRLLRVTGHAQQVDSGWVANRAVEDTRR